MRRAGPAMPRSKPVRASVERFRAAIPPAIPMSPEVSVVRAAARKASQAQSGGCPPGAHIAPDEELCHQVPYHCQYSYGDAEPAGTVSQTSAATILCSSHLSLSSPCCVMQLVPVVADIAQVYTSHTIACCLIDMSEARDLWGA